MSRTTLVLGVLFAAWLALVTAGFAHLLRYKAIAGERGAIPAEWSASWGFELGGQGKTLLMFAHPKCPCTRASLHELEKILADYPEQLRATIVFVIPLGATGNWKNSDTVQTALQMRGAQIRWDEGGRLATDFEAKTSGDILLYDEQGRCLFRGGITGSRGHQGINRGAAALVGQLIGSPDFPAESPVFGCPLFDTQTSAACGGEACRLKN